MSTDAAENGQRGTRPGGRLLSIEETDWGARVSQEQGPSCALCPRGQAGARSGLAHTHAAQGRERTAARPASKDPDPAGRQPHGLLLRGLPGAPAGGLP